MNWADLRADVRGRLAAAGCESADVEARWIVERVNAMDDGSPVDDTEGAPAPAVARAVEMVERRVVGEPLQYVLGEWSFRDLDVFVDPRVLVPRPETEITAEVAIDEAARLGLRRGRADPWRGATATECVADLGTGSGVLALALAGALADVEIWATDDSPDALAVARANLAGSGTLAQRIRLAAGCWFDALPVALRGRLSLVVANPPYVSEAEFSELPAVVARYEPRHALVAGPTGREAIAQILDAAPAWLTRPAAVVVEHAPHQVEAVSELARGLGFDEVESRSDLTGRPRVLVARLG